MRLSGRARWIVPLAVAGVLVVVLAVFIAPRIGQHGGKGTPAAAPTTTTSAPPSSSPTSSSAASTSPGTATPTASRTTGRPLPSPSPGATPSGFPAALRGQDVTVIPTSARVVGLTFDAGANAAGLSSILRTLAAAHVPATFFLTGTWAANNPAGVAAIRAAGHRVGNHSLTHPKFTTLSAAQIGHEVLAAQSAILGAGADPRPLFRFPFGDRDARTIRAVNDLGYVAVRWTVDTLGWEGTAGGMSAQKVADRALAALRPGEIVLMHVGSNPDDGTTFDADALPGMISRMRSAGYGFATLDALLG